MRSGESGTNEQSTGNGSLWLNYERRGRHMEAVLKNLAKTAELLAVAAHSSVVEQWGKQTLSRAFHWARYCEIIFSRFHNNPAIRRVMERQLQLTNESLGAAFPAHTGLSFMDLSRCQHLLLVALLNNPDLPVSIIRILFDTDSPVNPMEGEYPDVAGFCSQIVECKSACRILGPHTGLTAGGADAEVQGSVLMERLEALLSQSTEACHAEHFLDSILQGPEGEAEHFCLVIAAALLTTKTSAAQTASQDFLLSWLQRKHRLMQHMCYALPVIHLTNLTKKHQKFKDTYWDVLKKWGSNMEYNITEGQWVQTSANQTTVSYQKLFERLEGLRACPSLRQDVEKELSALKISDGDFDVRGLSVWGDLLSAFQS